MSKAKKRKKRSATTNRHHLLYQRRHWDKNGYALAIRNHFVYEMRVDRHDFIHENLHDIPLPPVEELEKIYKAMNYAKVKNAREACLWLADISEFEPFKVCMRYQASLITNANKL